MTHLSIGFANKFFTLWQITEETVTTSEGRTWNYTHYQYLKNISIDINKVNKLYPGMTVNEDLKGRRHSWSTRKEVFTNVNTFRFGKYRGQKIDDVQDINYLEWYWDQLANDDHKEYVENYLILVGYEVRFFENGSKYLVSPETLEWEKEVQDKTNRMITRLNNNEPLYLSLDYNVDEDGNYKTETAVFHFENIKRYWYQGYPYYLPVLNGKAKRIKNKLIHITDYTYTVENNNIQINIKNFEISK